jgi:hypothetical protein
MAMLTSLLISLSLCTQTVCAFLLASAPMARWFVVPVWFCGVLIGRDAVDWFRDRVSLKDGLVPLSVLWFGSRVMTGAEATESDPRPPAFLGAPSGRELA